MVCYLIPLELLPSDVLNLETDAGNKATIQVDVRKLSLIFNVQSIDIENAIICD